ncbi:hypothetical protein GGX14DRAFT_572153 [Mycena pura]|uniref:Ubiquitin-like protease family profile domain-containing protein n=1 Tax=Mycena pura TaxID=153505 RepID=A0AAD6V221_9AGAR|nr:hypothetical protein GGX14DRAFT_572153 [Mycena pura]
MKHLPVVVYDDDELTRAQNTDVQHWIGKAKAGEDLPFAAQAAEYSLLEIPSDILPQIPSSTLSITDLLSRSLPPRYSDDHGMGQDIFSGRSPSDEIGMFIHLLQIPSCSMVNAIRKGFRSAWLSGKKSISLPFSPNVNFAFWAITYWCRVLDACEGRDFWEDCERWVAKQRRSRDELRAQLRVRTFFQTTQWGETLQVLGIPMNALGILLSSAYLPAVVVDCMVALQAGRLAAVAGGSAAHDPDNTLIVDTTLADFLDQYHPIVDGVPTGRITTSRGGQKYLERLGAWLRDPTHRYLYLALYRRPKHWTTALIDSDARRIHYGDGLNWAKPQEFSNALLLWLRLQLGVEFSISDNLPRAAQTDGTSCGIIAVNTIAHNVFGDSLWVEASANVMRMNAFCDLVEYSQRAVPMPIPEFDTEDTGDNLIASHYNFNATILSATPRDETVPLSSPVAGGAATPSRVVDSAVVVDSRTDCTKDCAGMLRREQRSEATEGLSGRRKRSRSPGADDYIDMEDKPRLPKWSKTPASVTDALSKKLLPVHPFFQLSSTSASSSTSKPGKSNTSRKAKPSAPSEPPSNVGLSKSATKAKQLRADAKSATLTISSKKFPRFQGTILRLDPGAVIIDERVCDLVRCSNCTKVVRMKEPCNTSRFREHVHALPCCSPPPPAPPPPPPAKPNRSLDSFISPTAPTTASAGIVERVEKAGRPCPGLTEAFNLLFSQTIAELSNEQKAVVRVAHQHDYTWRNDFTPGVMASFAVGAEPCLRTVEVDPRSSLPPPPCENCHSVFLSKIYQSTISKPLPENSNYKYNAKHNQGVHQGMILAKCKGLEVLLAEADEYSVEVGFVRRVINGEFKDNDVFRAILRNKMAAMLRAEAGKGMQNFRHDQNVDAIMGLIYSVSPHCHWILREAGIVTRTQRSIQFTESSAPRFPIGIQDAVYELAAQYLRNYNYPLGAPISLAVDDTKAHAVIRPLYDSVKRKWFLVGTTGPPAEVSSPDALNTILDDLARTAELATKVRLFTLQIPVSGVPPGVLALIPIGNGVKGPQLATWHLSLMKQLISRGFHITASGGDGAAVERDCQRRLVAASKRIQHRIPHPDEDSGKGDFVVAMYELDGNVFTEFQDAKHGRKTFRNNASSGARALVLGSHVVRFQQIYDLAMVEAPEVSPMYKRDVKENRDRMDDGAAARLFSADTLEQTVKDPAHNLGLAVYLLIMGDFIDAWQSRTISHFERAKIVFKTSSFLTIWSRFLDAAGYSRARYFISKEAFAIAEILINGLLLSSLSTETISHVFAAMRSVNPDFSVQEAILMIPKLRVRMQSSMMDKIDASQLKATAAGYRPTYYTKDRVNLDLCSQFPTDASLSEAYKIGDEEAHALWALLGVHPIDLDRVPEPTAPPFSTLVSDPELDVLYLEEDELQPEPSPVELTPVERAQEFLDNLHSTTGLSRAEDEKRDAYAMAAIALSVDELREIENMPDSDPTRYLEIQKDVAQALSTRQHAFVSYIQGILADAEGINAAHPAVSRPVIDISQSDLSPLVNLRRQHQTVEAEQGVKTYRPSETYTNHKTRVEKPITVRQQLANQLNALRKGDEEQGITVGKGRNLRFKANNTTITTPLQKKAGNAVNAEATAATRASATVTSSSTDKTCTQTRAETTGGAARELALCTGAGVEVAQGRRVARSLRLCPKTCVTCALVAGGAVQELAALAVVCNDARRRSRSACPNNAPRRRLAPPALVAATRHGCRIPPLCARSIALNGACARARFRRRAQELPRASFRRQLPPPPSYAPRHRLAPPAHVQGRALVVDAHAQWSANKRRATGYANTQSSLTISQAGVNSNRSLLTGSWGFVGSDGKILLARVLTMYTKNGSKAAAHSFTPQCDNIGRLSYIIVQIYEQHYMRSFSFTRRGDHMHILRFMHIPSTSFLAIIPPDHTPRVAASHVELGNWAYQLFKGFNNEREAILKAAAALGTVKRKGGKAVTSILDLDEDDGVEE